MVRVGTELWRCHGWIPLNKSKTIDRQAFKERFKTNLFKIENGFYILKDELFSEDIEVKLELYKEIVLMAQRLFMFFDKEKKHIYNPTRVKDQMYFVKNGFYNSVFVKKNPKLKSCNSCGKIGNLLKCSRCNNSYYCNRNCQKKDYKEHKKLCVKNNNNN